MKSCSILRRPGHWRRNRGAHEHCCQDSGGQLGRRTDNLALVSAIREKYPNHWVREGLAANQALERRDQDWLYQRKAPRQNRMHCSGKRARRCLRKRMIGRRENAKAICRSEIRSGCCGLTPKNARSLDRARAKDRPGAARRSNSRNKSHRNSLSVAKSFGITLKRYRGQPKQLDQSGFEKGEI